MPPEAVDAFLAAAGPDSGSGLLAAELRQLGGAVADPRPEHAALSELRGRFLAFAVGVAPDDAAAAATERDAARVVAALRPWASDSAYLNFVEHPTDTASGFTADAWTRLRELRATYDPHGVLRSAHPVG